MITRHSFGSLFLHVTPEQAWIADSSTLHPLMRLRLHELFVTALSLVDAPARVVGEQVVSSYALVSCSGDNVCRLSLITHAELELKRKRSRSALGYASTRLGCFALLIAWLGWISWRSAFCAILIAWLSARFLGF